MSLAIWKPRGKRLYEKLSATENLGEATSLNVNCLFGCHVICSFYAIWNIDHCSRGGEGVIDTLQNRARKTQQSQIKMSNMPVLLTYSPIST